MNKNIKNVGAGILSGLESLNDIAIKEQKSKTVEEPKSKKVKEEKSKRSFMLEHEHIRMLYELKQTFINKDLSVLVGESIEDYYNKNKRVKK